MRKQVYVDALHEITEKNICVFWAALPEGKVTFPSLPPGITACMIPIYKEASKNKELYQYFEIEDGQDLPLLITFTFNQNDELLYRKLKLNETSPEQVSHLQN